MPIQRISSSAGYQRVLSGLNLNLSRLLRAQSQLSSGLRFTTPSEDPGATRRVLDLERRLAGAIRAQGALETGRVSLDTGAVRLEEASGLIAEAREHLVQAMNGTLDAGSRALIGQELLSIRDSLLSVANAEFDGQHLFGGSKTGTPPFAEATEGVVYTGDTEEQKLVVGGVETPVNLSGADVFAAFEPSSVTLVGTTGVELGQTANQGTGSAELVIRHDSTDLGAAAGIGITSAAGDADSLVGVHALVIDAVAGTARLGDGPAVTLPDTASPEAADVTLTNSAGGELHLDLSGWDGSSYTGDVQGLASISFDGSDFVPLDTSQDDLQLVGEGAGQVVHVDATGIAKAGTELVHYTGAENVFDLLAGLGADLSDESLPLDDLFDRLALRLGELDRHADAVGSALGTLGARSQRLSDSQDGYLSSELAVRGRLSDVQDADLSEVVLDLQRSELALQLSQAAGSRLISTSLLDYLR